MNKRTDVNLIMLLVLVISLIFGFILGAMFNLYSNSQNISIPSSAMINDFCEDRGFDNGWLNSVSCYEINQVQCHKKIGNWEQYECVEWGE